MEKKNVETFSTTGLQRCDPAKQNPCNDATKYCSSPPGIEKHFCYQKCDRNYNDCNDKNSKCLKIQDRGVSEYLCVNNLDPENTSCDPKKYGEDKITNRYVNYCKVGYECMKDTEDEYKCKKAHTDKTHTQADVDKAAKCQKSDKTHTQADVDKAKADATAACPNTTCDKTHTQVDIDNAVKAANDSCPKCTKTHTQNDIDNAVEAAKIECPSCNKTHTISDVNKAMSKGILKGKKLINCTLSSSTVIANKKAKKMFVIAKRYKFSTIILSMVLILFISIFLYGFLFKPKNQTNFF